MALITFYTKPGCLTSAKQIEILRQAGHTVEVLDLLAKPWTAAELSSYFGDLPVHAWFNPNAPRVKSNDIDPNSFGSPGALELMLSDHLLIRRPLMESGGTRMCGFDPVRVHAWVGFDAPQEALARSAELQSCSHPAPGEPPKLCP